MTVDDKIRLCRIVGVLMLSDAELHDQEVAFMNDLMDRLKLTKAQRLTVMDTLESGTEILSDVENLRKHGQTLLKELRDAAMIDGEASHAERGLIKMIESVLYQTPLSPPTD